MHESAEVQQCVVLASGLRICRGCICICIHQGCHGCGCICHCGQRFHPKSAKAAIPPTKTVTQLETFHMPPPHATAQERTATCHRTGAYSQYHCESGSWLTLKHMEGFAGVWNWLASVSPQHPLASSHQNTHNNSAPTADSGYPKQANAPSTPSPQTSTGCLYTHARLSLH